MVAPLDIIVDIIQTNH
jgi:hypothetical protein